MKTQMPDYAEFAQMRAGLLCDYAPVNAQERLLVNEVAAAWRRLNDARHREEIFFDIQRHAQSVETGLPKDNFCEGSEVLMWVEKPQRAYDQILRAIREAQVMFDRAIRRIEDVQDRRRKRERVIRKDLEKAGQPVQMKRDPAPVRVAKPATQTSVHTPNRPDDPNGSASVPGA